MAIGLNEVYSVVQNMNQNVAGGILYEFGNEFIIRGVLSTNKVEALAKAAIKTVDDVPVLLRKYCRREDWQPYS